MLLKIVGVKRLGESENNLEEWKSSSNVELNHTKLGANMICWQEIHTVIFVQHFESAKETVTIFQDLSQSFLRKSSKTTSFPDLFKALGQFSEIPKLFQIC